MMDMYQEELLDHYKNPRNYGKLGSYDIKFHDTNPLCGDEITVMIKLSNNKIKDLKFDSKGCAISVATASMLSEKLKGKSLKEVLKLDNKFILDMLGVPVSPIRLKCALLSLKAIKKGICIHLGKRNTK